LDFIHHLKIQHVGRWLFPLSDNGGTSLSNCAFSTGPTYHLDSVSKALCLETGSTSVCRQEGHPYSHELVQDTKYDWACQCFTLGKWEPQSK